MKTYKVSQATKKLLDKFESLNSTGDVESFNSSMDSLLFSDLEAYEKARLELAAIAIEFDDKWVWYNNVMYAVYEFIRRGYKVEVDKPKHHVILVDNGENCPGDTYRYALLIHTGDVGVFEVEDTDDLEYAEQWDYEDIPNKYKPFAVEVKE